MVTMASLLSPIVCVWCGVWTRLGTRDHALESRDEELAPVAEIQQRVPRSTIPLRSSPETIMRANPHAPANAKLHLHTMQELPRRARLLGRKVPLCLPFPNTSERDVVAACEHRQGDGCDEQGAVHSTGSEWSTYARWCWYRRGLQPPVCARGCGAALGMRPYCVLEAAVAQWYSEKTSGLRSTMPLCWHHEDCSAHSEGERVSQKACRPDATSWRTALNMRRE